MIQYFTQIGYKYNQTQSIDKHSYRQEFFDLFILISIKKVMSEQSSSMYDFEENQWDESNNQIINATSNYQNNYSDNQSQRQAYHIEINFAQNIQGISHYVPRHHQYDEQQEQDDQDSQYEEMSASHYSYARSSDQNHEDSEDNEESEGNLRIVFDPFIQYSSMHFSHISPSFHGQNGHNNHFVFHYSIDNIGEQESKQTGLKQDDIAKIPIIVWTQEYLNRNHDQICSICHNGYELMSNLRAFPCLHRFHKQCIDVWLGQKNTCPQCRMQIKVQELNQ